MLFRSPTLDRDVADLPLVELPASGSGDTLAVIVSGDGGWAGLDKDVGERLVKQGIPVVGLNSLKYFWTARTPEGSARDLDRIMLHYLNKWAKSRAVLIGYSMGADVLPFIANRLPPERLAQVRALVLLAPSTRATFEFHISNWIGGASAKESQPLLPEVERLYRLNVLCVGGADETDSLCRQLDKSQASIQFVPGAHHFGGKYQRVAELIVQHLVR